jgi:hypothetical protein
MVSCFSFSQMQDSICASLSRFPKLQCLTLSGGIDIEPFFARSVSWTDYAEFGIGGIPKKGYKKGSMNPRASTRLYEV